MALAAGERSIRANGSGCALIAGASLGGECSMNGARRFWALVVVFWASVTVGGLQPVAVAAVPIGVAGRTLSAAAGSVGMGETTGPGTARRSPVRLPVSFEPNVGQAAPGVRFVGMEGGATVLFARTQVALAFSSTRRAGTQAALRDAGSGLLRIRFVGADASGNIVAKARLDGVSNYLIGRDPSGWLTNVPRFGRIVYEHPYPGVTVAFYGNVANELEYDVTVAPGADPSIVRIGVKGESALGLTADGSLVVRMHGNRVVLPAPRIYQSQGGRRVPVEGRYRLMPHGLVGFDLARFDRRLPVVIDPRIEYSTYLGGSGDDLPEFQMALDRSGHAYACGDTRSPDFPVTGGAFDTELGGVQDAFVSKFSRDGTRLVYSTYIGETESEPGQELVGYEEGVGCAVGPRGEVFVTGPTTSTDFPVTPDAYQGTYGGGARDAYVVRLSASGSRLIYGTYIGTKQADEGNTIAVDARGDAFVHGFTESATFPVTDGALQTTFAGGETDDFALKLNPKGSGFLYSTFLGGSGDEYPPTGIAVDSRGDSWIAGGTTSADFPTKGALQSTYGGGFIDAFVAKLNSNGSALAYSTYLGGSGDDWDPFVAVDAMGAASVAGFTTSEDFPLKHAFQPAFGGGDGEFLCYCDGFVARIAPDGARLAFSTYLGGSADDLGYGIGLDAAAHVVVSGLTFSADFPTKETMQGYMGAGDAFVAEFTRDGRALEYSTFLGGTGFDFGGTMAVSPSGDVYEETCTTSPDFPLRHAFQRDYRGGDGSGFCFLPTDATMTKILPGHGGMDEGVFRGPAASGSSLPAWPVPRGGGFLPVGRAARGPL
jgi:hypothetical protein